METIISSAKQTVVIGPDHPTRIIGERINPTGRKKFAAAILEGKLEVVRDEAIAQVEAGADILDVNVGAAGADEAALMPEAAKLIMAAVDVPLCFDSPNPKALGAGLAVYGGKALINSVNGEEKSLDAVLPLAAAHKAAVIGLCMDDDGIPGTAEGRLRVAEKIVERAGKLGIGPEDILIDPLVLTVSADSKAGLLTMETIRLIKAKLGVNMTMGASNISFGLPNRPVINANFLTMAILLGINAPISNPLKEKETVLVADLLLGRDEFAMNYITYFRAHQA
ncbi:MAG: dihydropteroate synthase [Anaerolineae bacterium]|nr:dihydropteroate synthase [Anaerolineae bacterium]